MNITPALPAHACALLAFERENRAHFEQWVATRGDAFYTLANVVSSLEQAQAAALADKEYHYLAWLDQEIVGRITLRAVAREHYHKATLGYRFSRRHGGHGYATQAVRAVIRTAFQELGLRRLEAVVILGNTASQAVMRKCGFGEFGHAHSAVEQNGRWMDILYFELLADAAPR
ncbi:MAG: GNAT family N-acetyltransferase [Burkholderiales bacterium]|nr:GNAT family N-acetyltransferase [Burkholderiales bacterium]